MADFNPASCHLQFDAGDGPLFSVPCPVTIRDDDRVENLEDIVAGSSITSHGLLASFIDGRDMATINIEDNDGK